ncbi:aminotransferase class V-fold PLP-dependent enzyme [Pannus brasiliensis CCIBt3594]|uniref:Aminotransferase class V-fold PLP-dependent enzyme n=1 Tax=Pannus brasiliensis CCIBt3594 TaxID=1427578 RepID=A0AAW9R0R2_9CHRO
MLDIASIATEIERQRRQFPGLADKVYFNFGGQGILPRTGFDAIVEAHRYLEEHGPFSARVNDWITERTELLRRETARSLGVEPRTLSITEDVTVGCNIPLWGIEWRSNDHILLTDCEHPGIIATVQEIARRFSVEFSFCPILETLNGGDPVAVIERYLQPNTRLLVLSHVLWNTGQVLPLREISRLCHQQTRSVLVLVDAAQSVGCLDLNLSELEADFYAFTGHKWWCGPAGVGGLYVRPEAFESLSPTFIGWRGIDMDESGRPIAFKKDGRRFEVATSAYPLFEGLRASIAVHETFADAKQRTDRVVQLAGYLWGELGAIDKVHCLKNSPPESGLVSFVVEGANPNQLVRELEKRGFFLRTIRDPLCIRACVHYFTLPSEIDRLVGEIRALM